MPRAATPVVLATQVGQGSLPGFEGITPPLGRPTAEPCSECKTVAGRSKTPAQKPFRYSGQRLGLPGKYCETCYVRLMRRKAKGNVQPLGKERIATPVTVKAPTGQGRGHKSSYEPSPEVIRQRCKAVRLLTLGGIEPTTCPDKQEERRVELARKAAQVRAEVRAERACCRR